MRSFDSPFVTDWFATSLRWLILLGLAFSISPSDETLITHAPIFIMAIWNVALSVAAGVNRRFAYHRSIGVLVDFIAGFFIFWMNGSYTGAMYWAWLLPIPAAALYFSFRNSMGITLLVAISQAGLVWWQTDNDAVLPFVAAVGFVIIVIGLVFSYIATGLVRNLRHFRLQRIEAEEQNRLIEKERLQTIYSLTSTLTATLNYHRVLDSILDLSASALNPQFDKPVGDPLVSAVLLFDEDVLKVGSARRFTAADMRVTVPGLKGALAQAIEGGDPIQISELSDDPELSRFVILRNCQSGYCYPLRSGFNVYGVLLFAHPEHEYFTPDRREVLDILGSQAIVAMQNSRLYQNLIEEKERMVEAQEEARKKLARDLHDGPTQSVSAIAMRLNFVRRMLEKKPENVADELVKIEDLARRTTKEIRHMLFTLRPLVLESQGLKAALDAMAEKMKETFSENVLVEVDENLVEELELGKQGVIFYLVEEAVNNARKHARAAHIWVRLRALQPDLAVLQIKDDGAGFDVESVTRSYDKRGSLGMINLRERTELVNGLLHIDSAPDKGTKIQVFIPLSEEAADRLHHAKK